MIAIWYAIVSFMLLGFVVLEGFDIGAGILQCVVANDEDERRMVISAIGPLWSWNEVWLVAFGGSLLLAFPAVLAVTFSGFYLALMMLLWGLILRGVAIEVGGHLSGPLWRTAWSFCFVASNVLLAILIGAALGNVIRGVPIGAEGNFALPLFTNFSPYGQVGILDWYTVSVAAFTLIIFAAHGANGLAQRTTGPVRDRSITISRYLWGLVLALLIAVCIQTRCVRLELFAGIVGQPLGWLGLAGVGIGTLRIIAALRNGDFSRALAGSASFIAGLLIAGAVGVFPFILRSTLSPQYSLSAYQLAAARNGLRLALVWWPVAFVLAISCVVFIFRCYYDGDAKLAEDIENPY
jgi:cytochrome d ubiquinol oxidase subunit II